MFPLFVVQTYKLAIKSRLVIVTTAIAYINIVISLISIFMFIRNRNEKNQYYLDSIMKDKTLKLQEDYYKKLLIIILIFVSLNMILKVIWQL